MKYSEEVKKINLVDFLSLALNIKPVKKLTNGALYYNPFRNEENPSFTVFKSNKGNNNWLYKDHTDGSHDGVGTIIDFLRRYNNINETSDALRYIKNWQNGYNNPTLTSDYVYYDKANEKKKDIEINKIQALKNMALIEYLQKRKVNIEIAKKYVKEIYYFRIDKNDNKKHYFAICWENMAGGFDLRNAHFKGNALGKDITIIKGSSSENLLIFEGMTSFLSALTYYKKDIPKYDTIILNSVNLISKAVDYINKRKPKKIYDYLDNDFAGQETAIIMKNTINTYQPCIINAFKVYKGFNDFNDFLRS